MHFISFSCHFSFLDALGCSKMGGLVHFMLVCEFIEDPGKVCEMRDHAGDSATGQSDPNSSPMNSTT